MIGPQGELGGRGLPGKQGFMGFQGEQGLPGIAGKTGVPVSVFFNHKLLLINRIISNCQINCLFVYAFKMFWNNFLSLVFQGKLASEQQIRELCGSMIDGEDLHL